MISGLHDPISTMHAVMLVDRVREVHRFGHPGGVQPCNLVADLEPCVLDPAHHPVPGACTTERCNIRPRLQRMQCSRSPRRAPRLEQLRRTHRTRVEVREGFPEPGRVIPGLSVEAQPVRRVSDQSVDARLGQEREELDRVTEIERCPLISEDGLRKFGQAAGVGLDMIVAPCCSGPVRARVRRTGLPSRYGPIRTKASRHEPQRRRHDESQSQRARFERAGHDERGACASLFPSASFSPHTIGNQRLSGIYCIRSHIPDQC